MLGDADDDEIVLDLQPFVIFGEFHLVPLGVQRL
jgi:hypothetical protein